MEWDCKPLIQMHPLPMSAFQRAKLSLAQHPVTPLTHPVRRAVTHRIRLAGKCASDTHSVRRKRDMVKEEGEAGILGTFICGC